MVFPNVSSRSEILRMVYVSPDSVTASDGRERDIKDGQDIKTAFAGQGSVYGPYFLMRRMNISSVILLRYIKTAALQGYSALKKTDTYSVLSFRDCSLSIRGSPI